MPKLLLEIADSPKDLAYGLMFRKSLDKDGGMLFKFPNITQASFWGKNTYLPLDVAFVDSNNVIVDIKQIVPMSTRMIYSEMPCSMAIETHAGYFKEHGISKGSKIEMSPHSEQRMSASFLKHA